MMENNKQPHPETPTAALIIIGNEILTGRTVDANLNYTAKCLMKCGIPMGEVRVVRDSLSEIVAAVNTLRQKYTYVLTSGGIGPTHDDITAESVAAAFDVPVVEHPEARKLLEDYYGDKINSARLRMARVPEGAKLIKNWVSAAPGFQMSNVYVMAGVPDIYRAMLDVVSASFVPGPKIHIGSVVTAVPESMVADELRQIANEYNQVEIGSYPSFLSGVIGLTLIVRGTDLAMVQDVSNLIAEMVLRQSKANVTIKLNDDVVRVA